MATAPDGRHRVRLTHPVTGDTLGAVGATIDEAVQNLAKRVDNYITGTSRRAVLPTGIEQQQIGFLSFSILPWLVRWEQAIARDLILAGQVYFAEHVVDGLLRGDSKTRWETYQIGINSGILSTNEARAKENMNPREGGDE